MKLWVDDLRPAPSGYVWVKSVNEAKAAILNFEEQKENALDEWDIPPIEVWEATIEVINIDHDAGDYYKDGGDYIEILNWLELTKRNYPIHIHSMNVVGVQNMRAIIKKNEWREI